jgi:hypothetical protein
MPIESDKPFSPSRKNKFEEAQKMAILLDAIPSLRTRPGSSGRSDDDRQVGRPIPDSEFLAGLLAGDLDRMATAHRQGAKIDIDNNYPVRKAAREGHLHIVEWLCARGANHRADDDYAVRYACANGHLETAKWLHAHGADIRAVHDFAVIHAAGNGHIDTVSWLHENGANIRAVSDYPLREAVGNKHATVASWLCDHGADPKEIPDALYVNAARDGDLAMVAFLHKHKSDKKITEKVIHSAAGQEHIEILRYLRSQNVDVMKHIQTLGTFNFIRNTMPSLADYYNELTRTKNESLVSNAIAEALGEPAAPAAPRRWNMLKPSTWRPK